MVFPILPKKSDRVIGNRKSSCEHQSRVFLVRKRKFEPINSGNPLPYFDRTRTVIVFEQFICGVAQVGVKCDCHFMMRKNPHLLCS